MITSKGLFNFEIKKNIYLNIKSINYFEPANIINQNKRETENEWLKTFINFIILTHGTIIKTGITCKKIPCYMRDYRLKIE